MGNYLDDFDLEQETINERPFAESRIEERVKQALENGLALASTGAAAGIAVTKLSGHSKTLGAVTGIGLSLLLFGILKVSKRKK